MSNENNNLGTSNNSIYDELDKLTLNDLYASFDKNNKEKTQSPEKKKELAIQECLYDKSYICPVCGNNFKARMPRKGKIRFVDNEFDLKPLYSPLQPNYYDIVLCNKCGYAAMSAFFDKISEVQENAIKKIITPKFFPKEYPEIYTVDIAIERYKLALLSAMAKNSHSGEKAYLCLKLAWFYRDKKDAKNEAMFLKAAHKGFNDAFINEKFPICGLEENTLLYIIAAIGSRIGYSDDSLRILSRLIVKRNLNIRLKNKIIDLRDMLRNQKKNEPEKN